MVIEIAADPSSAAEGVGLILTASSDDTARLWRVPHTVEALVDAGKGRAPRCLQAPPPLWCVERRLWPYHAAPWLDWLAQRKI